MTTVREAIDSFLDNIRKTRRPLTYQAYQGSLLGRSGFLTLIGDDLAPEAPIDRLTEKHAMLYMQKILGDAPATRQLRAVALRRLYTYVAGQDWAVVSIDRLNFLLSGSNVLSPVKSFKNFDKERVRTFLALVYAWVPDGSTRTNTVRALRDRAFILTLAESGLRVHEACKLTVRDIDFEKGSGVIVGKGNKEARFKIGLGALEAIRLYLEARDGWIAIAPQQPVFARHDRRTGQNVLHLTNSTAEMILHRFERANFPGEDTKITCHTLRHHFVTRVLERTKNLKAAQILARHTNINITERYAHLLDDEVDAEFDMAINPAQE